MLTILAFMIGLLGAIYLFINLRYPWFIHDIKWLLGAIKFKKKLEKVIGSNTLPIDIWESVVKEHCERTMLVYKDKNYSFKYIDEMANRTARAAIHLGVKQGDTVAIMIYNEPTFVWTWLAFQKVGVEVAFINFNLRKKALLHSITVSGAKTLFIGQGTELRKAIDDIIGDLGDISVYTLERGIGHETLPSWLETLKEENQSSENISKSLRDRVTTNSVNCYIYTSGTTGLPKPAIIRNRKILIFMCSENQLDPKPGVDVVYACLPLYHTAGSMVSLSHYCFARGITIVIPEKFSASKFFEDCYRHNVTILQYVGEMCRYLVNTPPSEYDSKHRIRGAVGNGLRKEIWKVFQERFNIKTIIEVYAATELPLALINDLGVEGSIGKLTPMMKSLLSVELIKFDTSKNGPYRNNRCVVAKTGEPGLLVCKCSDKLQFDGYKHNQEATQKKLIHNVFKEGDVYMDSGDMFISDKEYNLFFYDRLGDTFRWKGENVSTTEVGNVITELSFVEEACVYGVKIPGTDGKAGMATISLISQDVTVPTADMLRDLADHCRLELPSYAIPKFLRVKSQIDMTSTYRQIKGKLKEEAFNTDIVKDSLFYYDTKSNTYSSLTPDIYAKICQQQIRF